MNSSLVDILLVDDRPDGLIAMEAVLRDIPNLNLVKAHSGTYALGLLDSYNFAVILLDVQMPTLDGFQTAELIRKGGIRYKNTPIIFVTAINTDDNYIHRGYEVGAVDYIFKPFEPYILQAKVKIFVDLFLKNQQLQQQALVIRESERREKYFKLTELEVESLRQYRKLADSIPHIVWKAKVEGTVDYFNKVWYQYTGANEGESIGLSWQSYIHPDDLSRVLLNWMRSIGILKSLEVEARIRRHDNEWRWHFVHAVPDLKENEILSWVGTCTDIHDRKISEEKLVIAQQQAVSANLAKTYFLANMSHEIRTPMSAILGFTELLRNPKQSESERQHALSTIHRNGKQLLNVIDEILDISKIEAGRLEIEVIDFSLIDLLYDIKSLLTVKTEEKKLQLRFILENTIPEKIYSDPTRVRQILTNIVSNAIKFTEKGSVHVKVRWQGPQDKDNSSDGLLEIWVEDTGVGIKEDQVDRLFQPFAQVDSSTTRLFGGTGLGLALSQKLAEALGGTVMLESTRSEVGSTFKIQIKSRPVENCEWVTGFKSITPENDGHTFEHAEVNAHSLQGMNILLVEDAPDNQMVIGMFLRSAGAQVDFADNGYEGISKAAENAYDIILMDIQMPKLDGYEATKILRKNGFKIPIIALTAHALMEERTRCLKVGCSEHFTKPVDSKKLIALIERLVKQNKAPWPPPENKDAILSKTFIRPN
ncbi:MAG: response regulator [Bdellovibrionaceae bacterium]|nr:response regulator [Pseudobdellovibrionaceae bacterium]